MLTLLLASSMLLVRPPQVVHAGNAEDLKNKCGVVRPIDACTRFVEHELTASCDSGGALTASARFTPLIILLANGAHRHELQHIADIRESVEHYLSALQSQTFASRSECETTAAVASSEFEARLYWFAVQSNAKRHANLRRIASAGH